MNYVNFYFSIFLLLLSCTSTASDERREISNYDFKNPSQIKITSKLNEVSDLTVSNDGNIFAINDEEGIIYKLNSKNGKVIKRFFLGKWSAEADFEGIAATKEFIYAISSSGILYKFREGKDEEAVKYDVTKLPFSSKFNIEGLYFDSELNGLLIVPKEYSGKKFKDSRAIYLYSLISETVERKPIITISLNELKKKFNIKDFFPSGIAKHPITGNYFIISARGENVLVEIDKSGFIIGTQKLKESMHRQPEGIAVLNDYSIIISDEAAGKRPTLTIYKYED